MMLAHTVLFINSTFLTFEGWLVLKILWTFLQKLHLTAKNTLDHFTTASLNSMGRNVWLNLSERADDEFSHCKS